MATVDTQQIFRDAQSLGKTPLRVPSLPELGVTNPADFFNRMHTLRDRAVVAFKNQCYIEYLSLMLLHIEVWLRIYLVGNKAEAGLNIHSDRLHFGKIIEKCSKAGMDQAVIDELWLVNRLRVDFVHNYLDPDFDPAVLIENRERISGLPYRLMMYVVQNVGTVVNEPSDIGSPGDIVILI